MTPDGRYVYVADEVGQSVSIIDTPTGAITATTQVGIGPFGAALAPNGSRAYIANLGPGTLSVLDTNTHQVTATVALGGPGTDPFSVTATAQAIYVTEQGTNALAVIDPVTLKILATIPVGTSPYGVATSAPSSGG